MAISKITIEYDHANQKVAKIEGDKEHFKSLEMMYNALQEAAELFKFNLQLHRMQVAQAMAMQQAQDQAIANQLNGRGLIK